MKDKKDKKDKVPEWFEEPKQHFPSTHKKEGGELPPLKLAKSVWGSEKIDLPYMEEVKNQYPLPDGPVIGTITGASSTGKSYMLLSLIPCISQLSQVVYCSKVVGNPVTKAIETWCLHKSIEFGFAAEPQEAVDVIEDFINKKPEGTFCLIVFDDFSNANVQSRSDQYNQVIIKTGQILRNYNCHSISITQNYFGHCTLYRNNARFMVCFRMTGNAAKHAASKDWSNVTNFEPEAFLDIYKKVLTEDHGYIFSTGKHTYVYLPSEFGEQLKEVKIESDSN